MKIFISAGEVSGDKQGAALAAELKRQGGNGISISALGGANMRNEDVEIVDDVSTLSSMGFIESVARPFSVAKILKAYGRVKKHILENGIDKVILIDNQGVNLTLSDFCQKNGIYNAYYFPPHVGIWGEWNAEKLKKNCDLVITQFSIDYEKYLEYEAPTYHSGHPFADMDFSAPVKEGFYERLGIDEDFNGISIALFPGSRKQELQTLTPVFVKSMIMLHKKYGDRLRFIIPVSAAEFEASIRKHFESFGKELEPLNYSFAFGADTDEVYKVCDMMILSSGTASLIAALYGKPMVINYKISPISFWIGKRIVNSDYVGMPNILAKRGLVPELLQGDCCPENITCEISRFIDDDDYRKALSEELISLRKEMGEPGVLKRLATFLLK